MDGRISKSSLNSTNFIKVVEGSKDGKPIKFIIKEIPEDRYEDAADHMCTYFLGDEAMCNSEDVKSDSSAVQEFRDLFILGLKDNLSVGAFVENPEDGKSIIAGLNVLYLGGKENNIDFHEIEVNVKSDKIRRIIQVMGIVSADVDVEKIYGSDKYIGGFGLSVDPSFRGNSIGHHLLLARDAIGRKNNISTTITVFTSSTSQKIAERAGFTLLSEKSLAEVVDDNGKLLVPNCKSKSFKCMGKRLP